MRKRFIIVAAIIFFCCGYVYAQGQNKLAIMNFDSPGSMALGAEMAELLTAELAKGGQFRIVPRGRINVIANELSLGAAGPLTIDQAVQVGIIAGADIVVAGKVGKGETLFAKYTMIDVRTKRIINRGTGRASGGPHELASLLSKRIQHSLPGAAEGPQQAIAEPPPLAAPAGEDLAAKRRLERKQAFEEQQAARKERELLARKQQTAEQPAPKPPPLQASKDRRPPVITVTLPEVKRGVKIVAREESLTVKGRATDDSGVAYVTVNDEKADLDENGNFSADILLKVGANKITITAIDTRKNQATETFTIRREGEKIVKAKKEVPATAGKSDLSLSGGRSYALIIGINDYRGMDKLKTAVDDAREVSKVLRGQYGFETTLILDGQATRTNILNALNKLRGELTEEDRLLIYYAGHGEFNQKTDTAYWLPVDAERHMTTNWIEAKSISDQLYQFNARHILIVADSCYSGTLTRKASTDLSAGSTRNNYLKKIMSKPARVLIASGGNEPVADAGGKGHSIFADVFLKALRNPEQDVFTAEELHTNYIRESVAGRTAQTPEYKTINNSGHEGGDFIFVRKK